MTKVIKITSDDSDIQTDNSTCGVDYSDKKKDDRDDKVGMECNEP